jgi:hypothetical protein
MQRFACLAPCQEKPKLQCKEPQPLGFEPSFAFPSLECLLPNGPVLVTVFVGLKQPSVRISFWLQIWVCRVRRAVPDLSV